MTIIYTVVMESSPLSHGARDLTRHHLSILLLNNPPTRHWSQVQASWRDLDPDFSLRIEIKERLSTLKLNKTHRQQNLGTRHH